jgi:hypothetical protein
MGAPLLKIMSLSLSLWAIRYYWKSQEPLDALAVRVRWGGILICIAVWFLLYGVLHSLSLPKEWIDAHPIQFVMMVGPPSFLCAALLLEPALSRRIARFLERPD